MKRLPRRLRHGEEATLVEHLGELRARLVICLLSIVVCFVFTYIFRAHLIHWLEQPLPPEKRHLVTFSPAEPFVTSFMVSFYASFMLSIPVIFWQIWSFFAPAFEENTQRVIAGAVGFATLLLVGGIAFGYFLALPAAVHFLTDYDSNLYDIQIRARDYLNFAAIAVLAVGVVFELPVFILALVRIGVLTSQKLRRQRRVGYVIVAAIAVALPGVDPVTTSFELLPMWVLFEGTIWLSVLFERRWRPATSEMATTGADV